MVCNLLNLFKEVTNVVSGSKYSTSNHFFSRNVECEKSIGQGNVKSKYNYCIYGDRNEDEVSELLENLIIQVILDPRFNLELLSFA